MDGDVTVREIEALAGGAICASVIVVSIDLRPVCVICGHPSQ